MTPWFFDAARRMPTPPAIADPPHVRYPCVVKPLGLSGSRGVIRADRRRSSTRRVRRIRALLRAARRARRAQRRRDRRPILVEGYIDGREYAVEGVLTDGALRALAIFDKPDPLDGPFFEETIYVTPSSLVGPAQDAVVGRGRARGAAALGLRHGPIHAECRVDAGGVFVLEVAARPIGGLCSRVLRFDAASRRTALRALEELLLRHALGDGRGRYAREAAAAAVMMIPIPRRGMFKGVR